MDLSRQTQDHILHQHKKNTSGKERNRNLKLRKKQKKLSSGQKIHQKHNCPQMGPAAWLTTKKPILQKK